ncbi:MFS transporter [Streptomyces termitum]|uniref:MFS transporter n=1 Tax=Streptomyces termitum TaxID=67368 RepID=A0A918SXJ2_9ACTN|nr:MFS transporter [Streptomyces termitum]GHA74174.1 MFS transporter [Streptomyces termitum]
MPSQHPAPSPTPPSAPTPNPHPHSNPHPNAAPDPAPAPNASRPDAPVSGAAEPSRPEPAPSAPAPARPGPAPGGGRDEAAPAPEGGYLAVFRVREFRFVFAAHLCSLLGLVVSEIALTVLVYDLTRSPLLSSLTFALGFLPYLLGGTLLAGLADRYPPRRVLVVCDLVCAACVGLMVVPATPVAGLLALRCAAAAVAPVFQGTRLATLADVLGDGDLFVLGRSLLRIVSQTALLAGFGVGGVLLTVVPARGAIALTAATFLLSALLLRLGTVRRPARAADGRREGLAATWGVLRDRRIRTLMLLFWVPPFFVVAPEALAAPYADDLGVSTAALGLLMCALPVGTVAGELLAGAVLRPATRSRLVAPLLVAGFLPFLLYALRPGPALAALALVLAGAAGAYTLGLDAWFVAAVPEERRGRAMTLMTAGMMTVQGLGMAAAGLAAEFVPVHLVVAGAGALAVLAVGGLLATERRDRADRHVTCR